MIKVKFLNPSRFLLLLILTGVHYLSFASTDTDSIIEDKVIVNVIKAESNRALSLYIANIQDQETSVAIVSKEGDYYFDKKLKEKEAYARTFNLSVLPRGTYKLIVDRASTSIKQTFEVSNRGNIEMGKKEVITKPVVSHKKGIVQVFFQDGLSEKVSVSFLNADADLIFQDNFFITTRSLKQFDISELQAGEYTVKISSSSKIVSKITVD